MRPESIITADAAKKLPAQSFYIKVESLAFWFWFINAIEPSLTFLFFQSNPALGTLVSCLPATGFALFLLSSIFVSKRLKRLEILQPMASKMLLALIIWAGITLLWTSASPLFSAFGYWASLAINIFVVLLLLYIGDVERVAPSSLRGYVWGGLVFALIALLLSPMTSDGRLGNEEFFHPNNIGNNMAIISLCAIHLALQSKERIAERQRYILIIVVLLFTLLKSLSKTSIACFLLAGLVYVGCSKISFQKKINILLLTSGVVAISAGRLSSYLDRYLNEQQGGQALTTATGRTAIWEMTWDMIRENPIWGYGFQSYRDIADQIIDLRLVHPHNELLNIWVNLGFIGLLLGVLTYISYFWLVKKALKAHLPQAPLGLALFVYSVVRGLTEASIPDPIVYRTALMMLMIGWLSQVNQLTFKPRKSNAIFRPRR
ncbi:O-antigen ligase family protein [Chlorogloeopsis fritschii PCC 9212]|uniref:O-antigen ligase-related domain-containing protein n=1 Tax=Chlorogloeopsis fritschii PCC 6912 TaxID=211165 RepID=A0A3S1ALQ0_CHLFR|nr:O-antigen ligase family protein [Chlorogloeopsis fritschii]RUR84107.1 hypothetical protein PCC6912_17010 [Chlorogloeopsis fritschii PCC 6912]